MLPQGLKAGSFSALFGTAEAAPFQTLSACSMHLAELVGESYTAVGNSSTQRSRIVRMSLNSLDGVWIALTESAVSFIGRGSPDYGWRELDVLAEHDELRV